MKETVKIYRLDASEAKRITSSVNEPHSHDYEELIIGVTGQIEHFIDFKSNHFDAPFVSFVTKGKVHQARPAMKANQCEMWVIRFKSEFIPETTFQLYSLYHNNATFTLKPGMCFQRLVTLCEMLQGEMEQAGPDYGIVRQLLSTIFTMIESERRKQHNNETPVEHAPNHKFKNFLAILEENFRKDVGVEFYAEKLFMSSRNLNLICHQIFQQSISEIIETRKLLEAKNLLASTDKTISEIGYELGFKEKTYFTNLFKKKTGQTPTDFRKEVKMMIS
ncbi:helix-turn-helix domain-containing protein [Chitinophaga sancti]|uniref:helix-turn-helix domain-containing protein n=1 Tax=Chitinophaga sancti TaxID=1004 RepID=UPI003F7A8B3C